MLIRRKGGKKNTQKCHKLKHQKDVLKRGI